MSTRVVFVSDETLHPVLMDERREAEAISALLAIEDPWVRACALARAWCVRVNAPYMICVVRGNILRWIKGDLRGARVLGPGYTGIHQHFIKIPGQDSVIFNCPRKMSNSRCPACEKRDRLLASGAPGDEQLAREFKPTTRAIPDRLAVLVDGAFPGDYQVWAALMLEARDGE